MNELDLKKRASDAAKRFFEQAKTQEASSLAKRLDLPLPLESRSFKAACFWFAAQKMYLLGREYQQQSPQDPDALLLAMSFIRGALDLTHRCEQMLDLVIEKVGMLKSRCLTAIEEIALVQNQQPEDSESNPLEFINEALRTNVLKKPNQNFKTTRTTRTKESIEKKDLSNPAALKESMQEFMVAQEAIVHEKLQFLPDAKLIHVLGFDALDGFALPKNVRQLLQHFVHLQTLFDTALQVNDELLQSVTLKMILVDTHEMHTKDIDIAFIRDGAFIAIQVLARRVLEWGQAKGITIDPRYQKAGKAQKELDQSLVHACFKLGFASDSVQSQVMLNLSSRGFFIGQGLLLAAQAGVKPQALFEKEFEKSIIDYPVFAAFPSGYRLLVSMQGLNDIAQVSLNMDLVQALKKQNWTAVEYFEVPENRVALRLGQISRSFEQLTLATRLDEANKVAQFLFLYLTELGLDWPEMFTQVASIKSLLRRKNLKIVWHEQAPFWTLKLRTEMSNPIQNKPFPRSQEIMKLLKRFDI